MLSYVIPIFLHRSTTTFIHIFSLGKMTTKFDYTPNIGNHNGLRP